MKEGQARNKDEIRRENELQALLSKKPRGFKADIQSNEDSVKQIDQKHSSTKRYSEINPGKTGMTEIPTNL